MDPLLTLNDLARLCNVSRQSIRRWIRAGDGPSHIRTASGRVRFAKPDVEKWLRSMKLSAPAPAPDELVKPSE
jgi:excisionase family DNA binding protein